MLAVLLLLLMLEVRLFFGDFCVSLPSLHSHHVIVASILQCSSHSVAVRHVLFIVHKFVFSVFFVCHNVIVGVLFFCTDRCPVVSGESVDYRSPTFDWQVKIRLMMLLRYR